VRCVLAQVQQALGAHDPVGQRLELLDETGAADRGLVAPAPTLEDPVFFSRLAPRFAKLYFAAIRAVAAGRKPSRVWEPMFEKRLEPRIAPLQFAVSGMNAHINHDLSIALVSTTKELGLGLDLDTPHHRDHMRVNAILARVMQQVKGELETGIVPGVDKAMGTADDLLANWSIETARNNAWTQAQMLVALERHHFLHDQYLRAIARTVAFTSRALLVRTGRGTSTTAMAIGTPLNACRMRLIFLRFV
jgi:hypothetical protein